MMGRVFVLAVVIIAATLPTFTLTLTADDPTDVTVNQPDVLADDPSVGSTTTEASTPAGCRTSMTSVNLTIEVKVTDKPARSLPGLEFPHRHHNTTVLLVHPKVDVCFLCVGQTDPACPAQFTMWRIGPDRKSHQVDLAPLCGRGFSRGLQGGLYFCTVENGDAEPETYVQVYSQKHCKLPPPIFGAEMMDYDYMEQDGINDMVAYQCSRYKSKKDESEKEQKEEKEKTEQNDEEEDQEKKEKKDQKEEKKKEKNRVAFSSCGSLTGKWSEEKSPCFIPRLCNDSDPELCSVVTPGDRHCTVSYLMDRCMKSCNICQPLSQPVIKLVKMNPYTFVCGDKPAAKVQTINSTLIVKEKVVNSPTKVNRKIKYKVKLEWYKHGEGKLLKALDMDEVNTGDKLNCRRRLGRVISPWSPTFAVKKNKPKSTKAPEILPTPPPDYMDHGHAASAADQRIGCTTVLQVVMVMMTYALYTLCLI